MEYDNAIISQTQYNTGIQGCTYRILFMIESITGKNAKLAWTLQEIAQETSLSVEFLRLEIKRGRLKRKKFGSAVRILHQDLIAYLTRVEEVEPSHIR